MKDIVLKITGKTVTQEDDQEKHEDIVELTTEGKLYRRGMTTFITYMESELSGIEGCKTSLAISEGKVLMKRTGEAMPIGYEMEFQKGKKYKGIYETPFGSVGMEILTNSVSGLVEKENGSSALTIDYNISLAGISEARNKLDIEILKQS